MNRNKIPVKVPIQSVKEESEDESNDEVIDVAYIIKNKPKTKVVREFLKYNLAAIKDEGEELFEPVEEDK